MAAPGGLQANLGVGRPRASASLEGVTYEGLPLDDAGAGLGPLTPCQQQPASAELPAGPPPPFDPFPFACWLTLLCVGYGFQRGLCAAGLPYDCSAATAAGVFSALTSLAFVGGGLAWLAGVTQPRRFAWLSHRRRGYLWAAYAAALPAHSALSNLPALQHSLASTGRWGAGMVTVAVLAAAVLLAAFLFHLHLALQPPLGGGAAGGCKCSEGGLGGAPFPPAGWGPDDLGAPSTRTSLAHLLPGTSSPAAAGAPLWKPCADGATAIGGWAAGGGRRQALSRLGRYLLPRAVVLLYFGAWFAALPASGAYSLHLHHYALGWAAASFAAFNHPLSGLTLALGTAVFVQGVGAYGMDAFFHLVAAPKPRLGCLPVSSGGTGQMTCAFWGSQPFNLSFCSTTGWVPWFDCGVEWPWPETKVWPSGGDRAGAARAWGDAAQAWPPPGGDLQL